MLEKWKSWKLQSQPVSQGLNSRCPDFEGRLEMLTFLQELFGYIWCSKNLWNLKNIYWGHNVKVIQNWKSCCLPTSVPYLFSYSQWSLSGGSRDVSLPVPNVTHSPVVQAPSQSCVLKPPLHLLFSLWIAKSDQEERIRPWLYVQLVWPNINDYF